MTGGMKDLSAKEQEAAAAIIEFLGKSASGQAAGTIGLETPLLEGSMLDSLGALQLVMFVGDKMHVEISDDDFVPEHFATVGSLARFVVRKAEARV